nr:hypothetical protein [Thermus parvatiensis]
MKGKAVFLTVLLGFALAQGRLEAGLYAAPPGLAPALEAGLSLEEGEVFLRLAPFRAALGYGGSLALGPLGFFAFGLQGEVGEGGPGGVAYGEGGAGPFALEGRIGYRPKRALPLFPEEGLFGRLALRYRPAPKEVLGLELARATPPGPSPSGSSRAFPPGAWREATPSGKGPPIPLARASPRGPTPFWVGRGRWGKGARCWSFPSASEGQTASRGPSS